MSKGRMDYVCNFSADSLIKELGLEPGGRVQKAVDDTFLMGVQGLSLIHISEPTRLC